MTILMIRLGYVLCQHYQMASLYGLVHFIFSSTRKTSALASNLETSEKLSLIPHRLPLPRLLYSLGSLTAAAAVILFLPPFLNYYENWN